MIDPKSLKSYNKFKENLKGCRPPEIIKDDSIITLHWELHQFHLFMSFLTETGPECKEGVIQFLLKDEKTGKDFDYGLLNHHLASVIIQMSVFKKLLFLSK